MVGLVEAGHELDLPRADENGIGPVGPDGPALDAPEGPATIGTEFRTKGADPAGRFTDSSVVTEASRAAAFEFVTEARLTTKKGIPTDWTNIERYELDPESLARGEAAHLAGGTPQDDWNVPGTASQAGTDLLREEFPSASGAVDRVVVHDPDGEPVAEAVRAAVADGVSVVVTTGGTGISPTDRTPEATRSVLDFEVPGVADAIRMSGWPRVPTAVLSRGVAGVAGRTFVVTGTSSSVLALSLVATGGSFTDVTVTVTPGV